MFTKQTLLAFVGALALGAAKTITEENPTQAEIDAARATVLPYSPVSNVKGLAFDRFVDIWLENTVCPVQHSIHGTCSRAHIF
jgi:acid phosphatase